ncbi:16S rRNA m(7)G-527 methyltransferase [Caminicella sporogenes DSM 14501]|uniref:Ribosomal RNA small subunit methyltransferase G n=1 Tax=Caminicella sporogenes DSM 14501 TaxID=1121266 RepID=A0A1M6NCQ4_9FIRM|nr:16S rRNA (guanine(527)-N(7))-methyltransferase RsmG [Caminicella sporogenes]RKD22243.1 16S rRNA methyltransferase G [Caminicella sporogenes]SHJ93500.1 16S rRNA m(7)G-527 methyltransferase [Caminicella sporogenes DSM 14501]
MNNFDILKKGGEELGLDIDGSMIDKFLKFKDLLIEYNKKINLTGITEDEEVMIKHFLDSLSCFSSGVIKHDSKIIDVGTGAGFPGVPLKIYYEDLKLTLLDSLNKRIKYLEDVCSKIGLVDVNFLHGRAEDYGKKEGYRESFDVAVARAVADLSVLCEYCLPFVKKGGFFIAQKGPDVEEEIKNSKKAIEILGGKLIDKVSINLPFSDITHSLIIIEKRKSTPKKYPRKAGIPVKNPIR